MSLADSIPKLQKNLIRWTEEVSSGKARGTLLQGIAGKAVNGFENVLRESLAYCLDLCEISYASALASDFDEKPLDKLTLGEVVQSFDKLDTKLTHCLRSRSRVAVRGNCVLLIADRHFWRGTPHATITSFGGSG